MALAAVVTGGCALPPWSDPPTLDLAGIDGLPSDGLSLRFLVRLRIQNHAGTDLAYDGIALDLDLRGQRFASGVAPIRGTVPRFGEAVVAVPVTVPALSLARQLIDLSREAEGGAMPRVAYALRGRLGIGATGGVRFQREGDIDLAKIIR